jgi:hypothetical protein
MPKLVTADEVPNPAVQGTLRDIAAQRPLTLNVGPSAYE